LSIDRAFTVTDFYFPLLFRAGQAHSLLNPALKNELANRLNGSGKK
jgi:hypothetical protein